MTQDVQIVPLQPAAGPLAAGGDLPYATPPAPTPTSVARIAALLRGRWRWAVGLALAGAAAGALGGWFLGPRPEYKAIGLIQVQPTAKPMMNTTGATVDVAIPMFDVYADAQIALLRSRRVIDLAMQTPEWQSLKRGLTDKTISDFDDYLSVVRRGAIIEVSFRDPDREAAVYAVRGVIDKYQSIFVENVAKESGMRMQVLEERRTALSNQIETYRKRIREIGAEFKADSLEQLYSLKLQELERREAEHRQAELDLIMAQKIIMERDSRGLPPTTGPATGPAVAATMPSLTVEELAANDLVLRDYLHAASEAERQLVLMANLAENHPAKAAARRNVEFARQQVSKYLVDAEDRYKANLAKLGETVNMPGMGPVTMAQLRTREKNLKEVYETVRAETLEIGEKNLQIKGLQTDINRYQASLDETKALIDRQNVEAAAPGRITVISFGDKPLLPFRDLRKATCIGGGAGGLALGFGLVLLVAYLDQRVKSLADARAGLRATNRILGILPTLPEDLADTEQASLAAYCVHHIRTLLQIGSSATGRRTLAITSPAAGDGKTSLTLALGLSFAAADSKTLLIDCDVVTGGLTKRMNAIIRRKIGHILLQEGRITAPVLEEALQTTQQTGRRLGEVLVAAGHLTEADLSRALSIQEDSRMGLFDALGGEPLTACVSETGTPGLHILPLGAASASHAGQLSPKALSRLLEEARDTYDVILIDTGTILGSLEASIASAAADEVVLAISRGQRRHLSEKALERLEVIGAHLAGLVFNRASAKDVAAADITATVDTGAQTQAPANGQAATGPARFGPVARAMVSTRVPDDQH